MRLNKARWLSLVLVCVMCLACAAQAEVAPASKAASSSLPKSTFIKDSPKDDLSTIPGVKVIQKGKSITYKFSSQLQFVGNKIVTTTPVKKGSPSSVSLSIDSLMGMNDEFNYFTNFQPLIVNVKPTNATITSFELTSSDGTVVGFSKDLDDNIWILGKKAGWSTITFKTGNGKKATKKVTVNAANKPVLFSSLSILDYSGKSITSKTMFACAYTYLYAQPKPYTATYCDHPFWGLHFQSPGDPDYEEYGTSAVTFSSSNESVASVAEGYLFANKPGSSTITATANDGSNKKDSFKLTVKAVNPKGFSVAPDTLTLNPGATYPLKGEFDPYSYYDKRVTWTSSAPGVAKVSSTGIVTAVSAGTATVTGRTSVGRLTDACVVTVSYSKAASETVYRFYGVGNDAYPWEDALTTCVNDLNIMANVATDAGFTTIDSRPNQTGSGIVDVLYDMMNNPAIDDNDVTVFYYSGHGYLSKDKSMRGALCGINDSYVPVDTIQHYLESTPGTIIVILDSCLSGQFITSKSTSPAAQKAQLDAFNSAWTSTFAGSKTANTSKALTSSSQSSRFKILTAASPLEYSWDDGRDAGFGLFTRWAAKGLGRIANIDTGSSAEGPLAADSDQNNAITLNELYNYVNTNLPTDAMWSPVLEQHVQVWPTGDNTAIVNKNP